MSSMIDRFKCWLTVHDPEITSTHTATFYGPVDGGIEIEVRDGVMGRQKCKKCGKILGRIEVENPFE